MASEDLRSTGNRLTRFLPLLVIGLAAALALRRLSNSDTWWHLAAGRWIVTHKIIPHFDTLSWTVPDHPWINLQWLFDVVSYGLFSLGGPSLLVASSTVVYTATIALLVVNVRRHLGPVATTLLGAWAVLVAQDRFEIRPEMISYLLLQVLFWLYATGRIPNSKRLWAIPAVICLWVNCHSLFILGAGVIACQMIGSLISELPLLPRGWRRPLEPSVRKNVLLTGAVALAATLVNPFFIKGAFFPFKLLSRISGENPVFQQIIEFRRPFESSNASLSFLAYRGFIFLAAAVVLTALALAVFRRVPGSAGAGQGSGRIDLADVAVLAGSAYLSLLARRNMALLAIGGAPVLAAVLALVGPQAPKPVKCLLTRLRGVLAAGLLLAALGSYWFIASNGFYTWNESVLEFGLGQLEMKFPIRAAKFMKAQGLPGPLYNDLKNGGYLAWAEPIPGGVYIDGRLEVYDTDFFGHYIRLDADPQAWQAQMDRRGIQTVLQTHWWNRNLIRYLVTHRTWALVYYDVTSALFVRREGNEALIARSLNAFTAEREALERALLEPVRSWQRPVGRDYALQFYSRFLELIGKSHEAQRFRDFRLQPGSHDKQAVGRRGTRGTQSPNNASSRPLVNSKHHWN